MTRDRSILIKNIYYMLSYAFSALNQGEYEDIAREKFDNIHNLFAAILTRGIGGQLKRGLYREYRNRQEEISSVRGKIDMSGTLRSRQGRKRVLTCEYDELTENNGLNQILKTTSMLLLNQEDVEEKYRTELKREMIRFSGVDCVDPSSIEWDSIQFRRNSSSYRMLIGVCRLVLEGMLLTTESGEYRLAAFADDQAMSRLYEKFILEYYRQEWPEIRASAARIPWALDDGAGDLLPAMQSDITLERGNRVLVIDAKYYGRTLEEHYDRHILHANNIYQIFTYVKNSDYKFDDEPHTVSGMLLYARTGESIQPDNVYRMHGNEISVKTLDLNRDFSEISGQLDRIAREHFGGES